MFTQSDFLLSISYPRNTKSHANVIYFLLVILSILIPVQSQSAPTCDYAKNPEEVSLTQMYCSPNEGDKYEIGQVVNLSWNPSNAKLFGSDDEVAVYLFRKRQNATGIEELVVLDPGTSTEYLLSPVKVNSMNFTVESRWLPEYNYSTPSENEKHTFVFRVIPKDSDNKLNTDFSSPFFFVLEPIQKPETNSTTSVNKTEAAPTTTNLASSTSIDSKAQKKDKSEKSAFIAFITVASIAAFLAFIAIVIAVRSKKRNNNQTKNQSLSNLSASSSTPMITPLSVGKFGGSNHDSESPEAESIHSTTPLANKEEMRSKPKSKVSFSNENQPISASDAALLSDAFRKVLRKPDWKPEDEEDDDTNLSQEERLRRREAKELMKKELAEEGTDLQNISRRHTKVEIRNVSDELEKDGVSRSSESGSK